MNQSNFRMPKSASVPKTFSEPIAETQKKYPAPTFTSTSTSTPNPNPTHRQHHSRPFQTQPQQQPQSHPRHQNIQRRPYPNQPQHHHHHLQQPYHSHHQSHQSQNIPLDYHLRLPSVIDNPKKLPKFDYIRVIPVGTPYAVYLQNNQLSFCPMNSANPAFTIPHNTSAAIHRANRSLFMAVMVKTDIFVITDIIIYCGKTLSTNEERLTALLDVFSNGILADSMLDRLFSPTHMFSQWTEFARGSLHIPYEIKHLEYCFYKEDLARQQQRCIYILYKKNLKTPQPHTAELVYTNSREYRVDILPDESCGIEVEDFKTCILNGTRYSNIVGYSHLDKQEESEDESE